MQLTAEVCEEAGVEPREVYEIVVAGNVTMIQLALGIDPEPLSMAPFTITARTLPAGDGGGLRRRGARARAGGAVPGARRLRRPGHRRRRARDRPDARQAHAALHRRRHELGDRARLVGAGARDGRARGPGVRGGADPLRHARGRGRDRGREDRRRRGAADGDRRRRGGRALRLRARRRGRRARRRRDPRPLRPVRARLLARGSGRSARRTSSTSHDDVFLSQRDVRELQFAKASIATGWQILCNDIGVDPTEISQVLLGGSFGSYLSAASAVRIGLVPKLPLTRIVSAGNVAGEGAKIAALSVTERAAAHAVLDEVDVRRALRAHRLQRPVHRPAVVPRMTKDVVACGALALHIDAIAKRRGWDIDVRPLPPELHNRPGADPRRGRATRAATTCVALRRLRHARRARRPAAARRRRLLRALRRHRAARARHATT